MANNNLTLMELPGSVVTFLDPEPAERKKIGLVFIALKQAGHAITADETFSHEEKPILRVLHYKTCAVCTRRVI